MQTRYSRMHLKLDPVYYALLTQRKSGLEYLTPCDDYIRLQQRAPEFVQRLYPSWTVKGLMDTVAYEFHHEDACLGLSNLQLPQFS